jgi:signal transduction histidine kinase/DNA-binding response OmpR family regulator
MSEGLGLDQAEAEEDRNRERSVSRGIAGLLLVASLVLIGQSLYNLSNLQQVDESLVTVRNSADSLEEMAREIATPIADIRMLSMESVLAPNLQRAAETKAELDARIAKLEARLAIWQDRVDSNAAYSAGRDDFDAIQAAWKRYREAVEKTKYFIGERTRVAAFISVTQQERVEYDALKDALAAFGRTQIERSGDVYAIAQANSEVAFITLVVTAVVQIVILVVILYFVYRMFSRYMQASKLHERSLARAMVSARDANQAKSAFLANMSHELRTPMNAILGYSEMLIEEAEDEGQEDFIPDLKKIHQAGSHLLTLINDVLDLSKIESGKMEAFAESFDVGALVDQVSGTVQPLMPANSNQFAVERGEELGQAYQDLTKLRQALLNLLSNASKFTHEGTVTLSAQREAGPDEDWLVFSVSDTGIGIAPDSLEHVFGEFSQADTSTTRDYGGTGLGLTISRRFCRMLGGDLTLTSQLGAGSTFTIRLPARLPGTERPLAEPAAVSNLGHPSAPTAESRTSVNSILVIDDDAVACEIIGRFLEKDGFRVVTALTGEEGIRLARQERPTAITLDVMMPDMDGWTVLRALKADPALHDIPVVMMTMVDDKSKGYTLGATDYLTKPVDRDKLHAALERFGSADASGAVLLVEDDRPTRDMMARTLEQSDWRVIEAVNGRDALDRLAQEKPQLILLDLMMPVMDGFEFLLEMRANSEWKDIPVIVLTAKDLTEEDRRILSGRVEQIIEKGARSHEQLLGMVRRLVAHHVRSAGSRPDRE